jgi:hypothetical protein
VADDEVGRKWLNHVTGRRCACHDYVYVYLYERSIRALCANRRLFADRGEAANHGLLDASKLKDQLKLWCSGSKTKRQAFGDFEAEMRQRTHEAVLLSRQACLDAHDIANLGPDSPLVSSRARVMEPGSKA